MTDVTGPKTTNADDEATGPDALAGEARAFETGQDAISTSRRTRRPTAASTPEAASAGELREEDSLLAQGIDLAQDSAERLRDRVEDQIEAFGAFTRENPMMAVGLTFGAGLILGMLLNRPRY
ncbi:MAG: hypothetical protein JSR45_08220 [Proteobacteria bacterium]|nr:hypothetical protein [Pseudomonadota bacterium]